MRRLILLLTPLLLSGCFSMPHPFSDPGMQARQLTRKNLPPARLAVPVPKDGVLPGEEAALWARDVATALLGQSVPAVAQPHKRGDWWLKLSSASTAQGIVPRYVIIAPDGKIRARGEGRPVDDAGWTSGNAQALNAAAFQMAPDIAQNLTGIQAQMMMLDPDSLMRRPAHVYFAGVEGAPGDGNVALGRAFYAALPDAMNLVQTTPKGADFTVRAVVRMKDAPADDAGRPQQLVEIVWHVVARDGKEAGAATQIHDVPAHSLDKMWGDAAGAAGEEAAAAARTIVTNYSGRAHKPLPPS